MVEVLDMKRLATERARWVVIRDDREDQRRHAAQDVIAMIDRVIDVVKQRDEAITAEHDALMRLDQWAEEAHSVGAERDTAQLLLAKIRKVVDDELNAELPAHLDPLQTRITPAKQIDISFLLGKGNVASTIAYVMEGKETCSDASVSERKS